MRISMRFRLPMLFVVLVMSVIIGCDKTSNINTQSSRIKKGIGEGELTGKVTRAPTQPVVKEGMPPSSEPASNIKLVILTSKRKQITSVMTNAQGEYRISLPPGNYRIETASLTGIEFTKDLPAIVTITEGRKTRLDIHIDTGIR